MCFLPFFLCIIFPLSNSLIVLSSSKFIPCVNDGSGLICKNKLSITLAVSNGQSSSDSIQLSLDSFEVAETGEIKKTTFNARPFESKTAYPLFTACYDDPTGEKSSCGWRKVQNQEVLPGFCCRCSLAQVLGLENENVRSAFGCKDIFLDKSLAASSHCMDFEDFWYDAYEIGAPEIDNNILINKTDIISGTSYSSMLSIGASHPIASESGILARLILDSGFQASADYSSKLLMIPSSPLSHPRVKAGQSQWMLIDKNLVGTSCNKIGVTYSSFVSQGQRCNVPPGSCLGKQLLDYAEADEEKASLGQVGDYLLSNYDSVQLYTSATNDFRYLSFRDTGYRNAIINIETDETNMIFVSNISPGEIDDAYVDTFEAGSKSGRLYAEIKNTGTIQAEYVLTIPKCSIGIKPMIAQSGSINPQAIRKFTFKVYSEYFLDASNNCTIQLYNSQAEVLDTKIVFFNTTKTIIDIEGQDGEVIEFQDLGIDTKAAREACKTDCENPFDVFCQLTSGCAIVFIIVIIVLIMMCCCCCCLCNGSSGKRSYSCVKGLFGFIFALVAGILGLIGLFFSIGKKSKQKEKEKELRRRPLPVPANIVHIHHNNKSPRNIKQHNSLETRSENSKKPSKLDRLKMQAKYFVNNKGQSIDMDPDPPFLRSYESKHFPKNHNQAISHLGTLTNTKFSPKQLFHCIRSHSIVYLNFSVSDPTISKNLFPLPVESRFSILGFVSLVQSHSKKRFFVRFQISPYHCKQTARFSLSSRKWFPVPYRIDLDPSKFQLYLELEKSLSILSLLPKYHCINLTLKVQKLKDPAYNAIPSWFKQSIGY